MSYSPRTARYIHAVLNDRRLCDEQTCHDAAKGVGKSIGVPHSVEARKPTEEFGDAVYRLDLKTTGVTIFERMNWNFDHSLAILRCETDLVFFQCFSRAYTLEEWLTASGRLHDSRCARGYSPASAEAKLGGLREWFAQFDATIGLFNSKNWRAFEDQATKLFGAGLSMGFRAQAAKPPPKVALEVRWRRYNLRAL